MRLNHFFSHDTLRGQLRFYFVLLVSLPVALAIAFFFLFERTQVLSVALEHLRETLRSERNSAYSWLESKSGDVLFMASLDAVRRRDWVAMERIFTAYMQTHQFVTTVVYVDPDGYTKVDPSHNLGVYVGDREYFHAARAGRPFMTAIVSNRASGTPLCVVSAPVLTPQGEFGGMVFMPVEMESLRDMLGVGEETEGGESLFLTDGDGQVLFLASPSPAPAPASASCVVLAGADGGIYAGADGREMIGASIPLGVSDWRLVRQTETAVLLAGYRRQMAWVGAGALATILALTPFLLGFLRKLERPLLVLTRYVRQLRATEYRMECPPFFSEAMPKELAELSDAFCVMAEEVRSHVEETRRQSVEDALTGLYNRRFLFSGGIKLLEASVRAQRPCSCLMLDVDHFKVVNDTYGHAAGDQVLAHLARVMAGCVRKSDLAARYGGEEFAVLLTGASAIHAAALAERIRAALAADPCRIDLISLAMTVSIGVAEARERVEYGENALEDMLARADKALYAAKAAGRDRVAVDGES